ncbi:hypothetical protein [Sandaracinus amylolyticus]|uniref:N-formylglutamate deformylase n=1 Tax=Sandaracinus amylolyticus TaxID=927083 RepID=A0A0F6SDR1_9BACT|nr:hypothetical protein [Sandaracinus amylolyticus]AKF03884.1 hypothetical protein DB32_001033 [Sandaracinus amylolyticus]
MQSVPLASLDGVAHVERLDGPRADHDAPPALLVEVPHGADRRAHYDALRARMRGALPEDLHVFFHVNTDVGAWEYGRRVAERVIAARPERSALLVRCLIPRTFVDTNRLEDAAESLATGGMTAGVAPYVRDASDIALLLELHRAYVAVIDRAYEHVCGAGGFALTPHTYGPRTMGIAKIDDDIVHALRAAHEPDAWARWPVRPEIDLITRTPQGELLAPEGMPEALVTAYRALGHEAVEGGAYTLHPSTQAHRFATRHRGQVLCLEIRRDLLVERYEPFDEMRVVSERADRFAAPIATEIDRWLTRRAR